MKQYFQKYPLYRKMIFYIALLVITLILVLSFVMYFNFEKILLDTQCKANQNIISEISYSAKYLDNTARYLAAYIYSNEDYSPLRYSSNGEEKDVMEEYRLMKEIDALVTHSNNVHSVYLYNGNLDRFYSTWWRYYSDSGEFLDQNIVEWIKNDKLPKEELFTSTPILRKMPLKMNNSPDQQYMNVMTYIMYDCKPADNKIQSAIIINLNSEYLDGLMDTLNIKGALKDSETFIINENGQVAASSRSSSVFKDLNQNGYVKKVLGSEEKSGHFLDTFDDRKVLVTYVSSDVLKWKFVNVTPYSELLKEVNRMKASTYLLCLGILVFGLPLAYLLARHLYSPIRSMMGRVEQLSPKAAGSEGANELEYITGILSDTVKEARSARSIRYRNDMERKRMFLKELLLDGNLNLQYIEQNQKKYAAELDLNGRFVLCLFAIDRFAAFQKERNSEDQKLFRFAVCNVGNELAASGFRNECFEVDDGCIALLLDVQSRDGAEVAPEIGLVVRNIQEWIDTNLHISLTAAVSLEPAAVSDLAGAFRLASELLKYRLVFGYQSVLYPDLLENLNMNAFEHPVSLEQKLEESLNGGKAEEAVEIYDKIIGYIKEYPYDTISSYLLYLSYLLIRKMNGFNPRGCEKTSFDNNSYISDIISYETLEEISTRVTGLIRAITDAVEQKRQKRKNAFAEKVKTIIENEYRDKLLCQDITAKKLNISRDYLGKIFREAYSKSFSDYLTEVRLQKAAEMLNNPRASVSRILEEIGWENKNYFYTSFKQKYGMTTSEYRSRCG